MGRAGGIVALIAGILGVLAATVTLLVGACGTAFEAEGASTVTHLGWGGVAFSFATIVLGAVAMTTRSRVAGALLVVSALAGAILGGTFVAVMMALALLGGLLVLIGGRGRAVRAAGDAPPDETVRRL